MILEKLGQTEVGVSDALLAMSDDLLSLLASFRVIDYGTIRREGL